MQFVEGPIPIGEWLPDIPDLKFPNLVTARNVEPVGTVYKSFAPLVTAYPAVLSAIPKGFGVGVMDGEAWFYAATRTTIAMSQSGTSAFTVKSASTLDAQLSTAFLQFDDLMIATNYVDPPLAHTIGASSQFATLGSTTGSAPKARCVGRINKFLILGDTSETATGSVDYRIQWSGIDQPFSWPLPNSATAIAQQSGEQYMDAEHGRVTGFANGDQFGLVFQTSAITRVNYVGPPVVFQFDKISDKIGCPYPKSIVQVGSHTYFISSGGFFMTDGVQVVNIGMNKCNNYFLGRILLNPSHWRFYGAANQFKNLIYWTFCDTSDLDSTPAQIIIYNYVEGRFTEASQVNNGILSAVDRGIGGAAERQPWGFGAGYTLGQFSESTTLSAFSSFETGDIEFNPGGFSRLSGAKLLVDQTANAVIGYAKTRTQLVSNQLTSSSASTCNADSGFCPFRSESRYHRARFEVAGIFDQATAMEFIAKKSGAR
jgi:hypothetical protein